MSDDHAISIGSAPPETVLPDVRADVRQELEAALARPEHERRVALGAVASAHPRVLEVWAELSRVARDPVEAYAYARVGYHRGLDTLRGAGWRGSGYVRWRHDENRGFLKALDALRRCAESIGEEDEQDRCALFLRQLDPDWDRVGPQ